MTGSLARDINFKISSYCTVGSCVAVGMAPGGPVIVRDTKDPSGESLQFTTEEWSAFVAGVKAGEFDVSRQAAR